MDPARPTTTAEQDLQAASQRSVAPTTTLEEDQHSASQRRVNLIWEYTQASIAIGTVLANIVAAFYFAGGTNPLLANAFFLIVGFYFGRTNHQRIGGVYLGR